MGIWKIDHTTKFKINNQNSPKSIIVMYKRGKVRVKNYKMSALMLSQGNAWGKIYIFDSAVLLCIK